MLPKIPSLKDSYLKKENIAANIICENHIKGMLAKTANIDYKPWKSKYCPANPQSPFGDFPKSYLPTKKQEQPKHKPIYEDSMSASAIITTSTKKIGTGGKPVSTNPKKQIAIPPIQISGAFRKRFIPASEFRRFYDRGDLPVKVGHSGSINKLVWTCDESNVRNLDYNHYLPIFFDGLREKTYPYNFLSLMGTCDLLEKGEEEQIFYCLGQLILPMKTALNTRDPDIISLMLKVIQKLAMVGPKVGAGLLPYFRQILPLLSLYKSKNLNMGDKIDYNQRKQNNLGDLIQETLEILEKCGGEDAFINIKYMIPTYESCVYVQQQNQAQIQSVLIQQFIFLVKRFSIVLLLKLQSKKKRKASTIHICYILYNKAESV